MLKLEDFLYYFCQACNTHVTMSGHYSIASIKLYHDSVCLEREEVDKYGQQIN